MEAAPSLSRLRLVDSSVRSAFESAGLHSLWQLVELALTARERRFLARKVGVSEGDVLKLARIADMCRVCDVGLAELLVEAGVNTPFELPLRPLDELYAMVAEKAEKLGIAPPDRSVLEELRRRSRSLPPLFDY